MNRLIFVNLPVVDLERSVEFYAGLGFDVDDRACDDGCACVRVSSAIVVMLVSRERFADFVVGPVGDPAASTSSILCLTAASPDEVDALHARAVAHGGKPWKDVVRQGPMYGHSFADPDGHVWELLHSSES